VLFNECVVMNNCFLLNPVRKKFAQIRLVVFEKNTKNAHFNSENDVTEPKVIGYFKIQINVLTG